MKVYEIVHGVDSCCEIYEVTYRRFSTREKAKKVFDELYPNSCPPTGFDYVNINEVEVED